MKIFLFSSIPGLQIKSSIDQLKNYAEDKKFVVYTIKIEDFHIKIATPVFEKYGIAKRGDKYTYDQVLALPFDELLYVCNESFKHSIQKIAKLSGEVDDAIVFLMIHPVLYHQQTREFANPYISCEWKKILAESNLKIEYIISVHDDIYDTYRPLLKRYQLFDPISVRDETSREKPDRNPIKDIIDLHLILNWRDRELSSAINKAAALGSKHLLFHYKGRMHVLWDIIMNETPFAYLSHPIAQPRRDILGITDLSKNPLPDKQRGKILINEIQKFADHLARFMPIIEPTSIDELRINFEALSTLSINDLKDKILPPLTERWPIGKNDRLCFDLKIFEQKDLLLNIDDDIYSSHSFSFGDEDLTYHESGIETLKSEIQRQINVRDHVLSNQADYIIAFRPFSLPASPQPTSGVLEEINTLVRKLKAKKNIKNKIIIIHPNSDEERRRRNEFEKIAWPEYSKLICAHGSSEKDNAVKLDSFKKDFINIVSDLTLSNEKAKAEILKLFETHSISIKDKSNKGSMPSEAMFQELNVKSNFIDRFFSDTTVFESVLHEQSKEFNQNIILIENYSVFDTLKDYILNFINPK